MHIRRSLAAMSVITLLLSVTAAAQEAAAVGELVTDRPDFTAQAEVTMGVVSRLQALVGRGDAASATPTVTQMRARSGRGRVLPLQPRRRSATRPTASHLRATGTFG